MLFVIIDLLDRHTSFEGDKKTPDQCTFLLSNLYGKGWGYHLIYGLVMCPYFKSHLINLNTNKQIMKFLSDRIVGEMSCKESTYLKLRKRTVIPKFNHEYRISVSAQLHSYILYRHSGQDPG